MNVHADKITWILKKLIVYREKKSFDTNNLPKNTISQNKLAT